MLFELNNVELPTFTPLRLKLIQKSFILCIIYLVITLRITHKLKHKNIPMWLNNKGYAGKLNVSDKFYTRLNDTIIAGRTCKLYYVNNSSKYFALVDDGKFIYVLETKEAITEFNIKFTMENGGEVPDEILNQIAYEEYLDWDNKKPPL